jgi:hypothetical protein
MYSIKHISIKYSIFLILLILAIPTKGQDIKGIVKDFIENYTPQHAKVAPSRLDKLQIDKEEKTISLYISKGLQEQYYTDSIVESVYNALRDTLPESYKNYQLKIVADNKLIEELVPNILRNKDKIDNNRLSSVDYKGAPWMESQSKPYSIAKGLSGRHMVIWQSHGIYYTEKTNRWEWQRPRLFCTSEDIFTQTFVIPYIIPMLQNSGAVVYTPRERDWQCNEVIVDNDLPEQNGAYIEINGSGNKWNTLDKKGFGQISEKYNRHDTPFEYGTARHIKTTKSPHEASTIIWTPNIPEKGLYAVYVSYQTTPQSISNAKYKIHHKGGCTEFYVNQKMGGGTWVYLGTYEFTEGHNENNMVTLTNLSDENGIVTADAVRFGGGMGNIHRGISNDSLFCSGLPRWAEGALYNLQWSGIPTKYTYGRYDNNDYKNDINARSASLNYMSGGSVYNPQQQGLGIPFELSIGVHSDAGFKPEDELVGTLAIYNTKANDGVTPANTSRYASRDLTSMLLQNLATDLNKYNWKVRALWNRDYSEAREPLGIAAILELLSHQNWSDMKLGHNPHFKFDLSRSVYKTITKFLATQHQKNYVIHPLPINSFAIDINSDNKSLKLSWEPTDDKTEPTAVTEKYILYTRKGNASFDNGRIINNNSCNIEVQPGIIYSFRVAAVNSGGESFPSETLCAYISPNKYSKKILIINAFDRLDGPAEINTSTKQGFNIDIDPGVPYGAFPGFCGNQLSFDRNTIGKVTPDGLGYSGNEYEGKIIIGNTFDYPFIHGLSINASSDYSFTSTSEQAFLNKQNDLKQYHIIDIIYGVQKEFTPSTTRLLDYYCQNGGNLIVSGANIFKSENFLFHSLAVKKNKEISDKNVTEISDNKGLLFNIYRKPNPNSYSVPAPISLAPTQPHTKTLFKYSNGESACIYTNNNNISAICFGFPFESITDQQKRNIVMGEILHTISE